ncbi:PadR family transcriptional regulator [Bacillus velezensis]|uniref:PadR family transcriptional regulator n=2 Tax=Bacillaceae TaxID=186817 RepID=UPI00311AB88B
MKKKMSGYDIKLVFEDVFSHFFDGSFGMIYPTLRQLEKEGKIKKEIVTQDDKPNKKLYSITEEGVKEFHHYLETKVEKDILCSDFLMRMYFGEYKDLSTIKKWIEDEIVRKEKNIEDLRSKYGTWKKGLTFAQEICLDVGISQYQAQVITLKEKLAQLVLLEESVMLKE